MAREAVIRINSTQVKRNFEELNKVTRNLERQLRKLTPGTEAFIRKAEDVKKARTALREVREEINAVRKATEKSESWFNRLGKTIGTSILNVAKGFTLAGIFEGIGSKIYNTGSELLALSDAMSAVKKTTGLAQKQVKELWEEFDHIDTRTTKMELMKIAEMAGRLGIQSKEEVAAFTAEIDKAYVALGDSFSGGIEAVATKLGKLKNLFKDTSGLSYAEGINKIGSALNELAANGTASEENISDFALRVGQLPEALRPGISATLGLGAAFEESGVDAQIAASGYSRFISTAAENIEAFAYSMHMGVEEAQALLNTQPEAFFLRFAAGMQGLSENGVESAKVLEGLKLNSLEVQKAIGSAAGNIDRFTQAMDLSKQSMEEMTSLNNEFNEVNNNAAAIWQKIKNAFGELFTSGEIFNNFSGLIEKIGNFAGVTQEARDKGVSLRDNLKTLLNIIKVIIPVWTSYILTKKATILFTKQSIALTKLETLEAKKQSIVYRTLRGSAFLLSGAKALLRLNIKGATMAMRSFNRVTRINPLGLLISLLTTAISYFIVFKDELDETTEKTGELTQRQKDMNDVMKTASESVADEMLKLSQLYKKATDATQSTLERKKAIEELRKLYPDYFKDLSDEIIMNGQAQQSYEKLRESILDTARAKALEDKAKEYMSLLIDVEQKEKEIFDFLGKRNKEEIDANGKDQRYKNVMDQLIWENGSLEELEQQEKELNQRYEYFIDEAQKLKEKNKIINTNTTLPSKTKSKEPKPNRPPTDTLAEAIEKRHKAALSAQEKWGKALTDAEHKAWDERHALQKDSMKKEIEEINEKYRRAREKIQEENAENLKTEEEYLQKIEDLKKLRDSTKDSKKQEAIDTTIATYREALGKMENLLQQQNDRQKSLEQAQAQALLAVKEKYLTQALEEKEKKIQEEIRQETLKNEQELALLNLSEAEKEKRREAFHKQQLEKQLKYISALVSQLENSLETGKTQGLVDGDFVMTEAAKKEAGERMKKLVEQAIELKKEIDKLKGKTDEKTGKIGLSFEQTDLFGMSPSQWDHCALRMFYYQILNPF